MITRYERATAYSEAENRALVGEEYLIIFGADDEILGKIKLTPEQVTILDSCDSPQHASDCAVNNEPALPAGPCNCGAA